MPIENGFDHSYLLKDQGRFFNPKRHWKDDVALPPVEKDSGFYATTALADHAIEVLKEHQTKHSEKPFFHYLAFAAPHFPLHALPDDIAVYKDTYKSWLGSDSVKALASNGGAATLCRWICSVSVAARDSSWTSLSLS